MFVGLAVVVCSTGVPPLSPVRPLLARRLAALPAALRLGLPIAATLAFEVTIFNAAVFLMGLIGAASLAAHAIAIQIASLAFMVPLGLGQAVTVRVGRAYRRRRPRRHHAAPAGPPSRIGVGFMALTAADR